MPRVGFVVRPGSDRPAAPLAALARWLCEHGHTPVITEQEEVRPPGADVVSEDEFGAAVDLAVVLGGDGTMLYAAALVADFEVPLLGINRGRLGFLSPFDPDQAEQALDDALAGRLTVSERSRLRVEYRAQDSEPVARYGLNDAVVHQGTMARMIELSARLDGELITTYRADGLIVTTPTGSTAYNLAAGGPILMPGLDALAITPICAHALTHRPLVVPKASVVSVSLVGAGREGLMLTVDGLWAHPIAPGDRIEVRSAERPLRVYESNQTYFDILREKLHWGARYR